MQCGAYPSCHIDATCSGGGVPASRFSFNKKGGRGTAAGKEGAAEGKGGRGSDAASHVGKKNGTGEGGGAGEGGEGAKKPDGRWRRVITQLSSPHESRFFDICRLAGGKHLQQNQLSESVL